MTTVSCDMGSSGLPKSTRIGSVRFRTPRRAELANKTHPVLRLPGERCHEQS